MIFRYKSGKIKNISRDDFLTDKEYYMKILEAKSFLKEEPTEVLEKDVLVETIIGELSKNQCSR